MGERISITEYLDLEICEEYWYCSNCNNKIYSARDNYKKGCLLYERDPREIHPRRVPEDVNFSPDPGWVKIIEYYCPNCGTQIETEYLPPGHPITYDIEIDLDSLKKRLSNGELMIVDKRLEVKE